MDEKVDIYSLSYVLWTLRSREYPLNDIKEDVVYRDVNEKNLRPSLEKMNDYPIDMQQLIIECWNHNPKKRPSAQQLVDRITLILIEYKKTLIHH